MKFCFFVHYIDVVSNCLYFHFFPREVVINYGKVCVTFHELGSSLSRTDKVPVHSHVINALCRKLFKDRHPSVSRRHYFFSTAGVRFNYTVALCLLYSCLINLVLMIINYLFFSRTI